MDSQMIDQLQSLLHQVTGIDFRQYKRDFLERRTLKRIQELHLKRNSHYLEFIKNNPGEVTNFLKNLTVDHTYFFRDPNKFKALKDFILPELLGENRKLRIWSAGCAGGEEPYSISIILCDLLGGEVNGQDIIIYGTDINETLLERARRGVYEMGQISLREIDSSYLQRHFEPAGNRFILKKRVKDLVRFSKSNLIYDKPLVGTNIIFCKNVLIYLDGEATRKIILNFYHGLNRGGYLFLGNFELLEDYFLPYFEKVKIYGEFIYRKITPGSRTHKEMLKKQRHIKAVLSPEKLEKKVIN